MKHKEIVFASLSLIASIAVNCLGSALAEKMVSPLYLDSLMTIFIVFRFNLLYGIACAFLTNLMLSSFSLVLLPFSICHVSTALVAWFIKNRCMAWNAGFDKKTDFTANEFLFAGFFSAISNTVLGNLIAIQRYKDIKEGMEGLFNSNFLAQSLHLVSGNIAFSIYVSGLISNLTDKIISALVSFVVYRIILIAARR